MWEWRLAVNGHEGSYWGEGDENVLKQIYGDSCTAW